MKPLEKVTLEIRGHEIQECVYGAKFQGGRTVSESLPWPLKNPRTLPLLRKDAAAKAKALRVPFEDLVPTV